MKDDAYSLLRGVWLRGPKAEMQPVFYLPGHVPREGLHLTGEREAFFSFPQRHYMTSPGSDIKGFKCFCLDVV